MKKTQKYQKVGLTPGKLDDETEKKAKTREKIKRR